MTNQQKKQANTWRDVFVDSLERLTDRPVVWAFFLFWGGLYVVMIGSGMTTPTIFPSKSAALVVGGVSTCLFAYLLVDAIRSDAARGEQ
jgi:hypothetical protein